MNASTPQNDRDGLTAANERDVEPHPGPEQRLESLRFFARESQPELPKSLYDWMQEVETQVVLLRESIAAHRDWHNDQPRPQFGGRIVW